MAKWLSGTETEIYVGDTFGNAVALRVGIVEIGRRVTVGFQRKDDDGDQPAYTLDTLAVSHMIRALQELRTELINRTGGFS